MAAQLDLFAKPEALHAVAGDTDIQIIAVDTPEEYARAHIPGAQRITMAEFTTSKGSIGGLIPNDDTLVANLSAAGLRDDRHIVAYDRTGGSHAARLLYTLDVAGHSAFSLLDGGLTAWHAAGLPLDSGMPAQTRGTFHIARQNSPIADRAWISTHRNDEDVRLLDARSAAEFIGQDIRSARGGHIPGAVNIDWQQFKDANGQLRDLTEIRRLLAEHDIDESNEVATYCQTHMRSSYLYLVLKALGYDRIRGYPGAWSDWGNASDTPIETRSNG